MGTESKALKVGDELEAKVNNYISKKRCSTIMPLSVFSKTFLAVLLAHAGILTALGLFVQQPVVLILAGLEACVASLTLFGLRWIPILGSMVGFLMLLVFTTATALPIHHLTHPKDAFGYGVLPALSFLMYVVMTGLFWCAAMLIVTGVTTVIHTYFFARWKYFPWFKTVLAGAICLWCGAVMVGALTQPERPINTLSPNTVALEVGSFSQTSISLTKGENLTIVDIGAYHHNLSMGRWMNGQPVIQNQPGAPSLTNKDVNAAGQTVILGPFNTAGTFYLMCSLHHNMMLKITVT
jgi:hypothetical protein